MRLTPEGRDRLARRLTAAACVAVAVVFAIPLFVYCRDVGGHLQCSVTANRLGANDWRYYAEAWEAVRVSLLEFHQFPSWNPYHCGGLVLYQESQTIFPSPLFLLLFFWLPTAVGFKVWLVGHLVVGALGMRALARDRGASGAEQVLAATLVTCTGFWAHRMGGGHPAFAHFLLLPYMLWANRRALDDPRWAVLVAALLALTVYEGGPYPLALMLAALGADCLLRLGDPRDRRALAVSLTISLGLFPLLAAARLIPVVNYLREHPRLMPLDDAMTVAEVFGSWLTRRHEWTVPGHKFVWPEYGNYMGPVAVALMVVGLVLAVVVRDGETRARRIDAGLLAILVWCALGNIPGLSLFGLLHLIPIYASLRVPSRFLCPAGVAFALVAVSALVWCRRALVAAAPRPALLRAFVVGEALLVAGIAVDLWAAAAPLLEHRDHVIVRGPARRDFAQRGGDYSKMPSFPVLGIGTRQCYTPIEWKPAAGVVEGEGPQARIEPATAGKVTETGWSPSRLSFAVELSAPGTLVVNQNYETGWRTSTGEIGALRAAGKPLWRPGDVAPPGPEAIGVLAVSLPAGRHEVQLQHRPRGLAGGVVVSLIGLALALTVARRLTPAARERLGAAARRAVSGRG